MAWPNWKADDREPGAASRWRLDERSLAAMIRPAQFPALPLGRGCLVLYWIVPGREIALRHISAWVSVGGGLAICLLISATGACFLINNFSGDGWFLSTSQQTICLLVCQAISDFKGQSALVASIPPLPRRDRSM
jgi:hypothetical protein